MNDVPKQTIPFNRYLDDVGDGTGVIDITGDYSSNNTEFRIIAQDDEVLEIHSMAWFYLAVSPLQFAGFGVSTLGMLEPNGVDMDLSEKDDVGVYQTIEGFTEQQQLIRNGSIYEVGGRWNYDTTLISLAGLTSFWMLVNFREAYGHPLYLRGNREGKFAMTFRENMTFLGSFGIFEQRISVQGTRSVDRYSKPF